jgi:hypothetical protein
MKAWQENRRQNSSRFLILEMVAFNSGWLIAEWPQSAAVPKAKARRSKARKLGEKRVVGYF